ncbi:MAG TPA: OprD family outer membrane porin [Luteibaculaceae bacterium]|nr:OprD family outer membrane porin [Luteibaculaceae bacterium]
MYYKILILFSTVLLTNSSKGQSTDSTMGIAHFFAQGQFTAHTRSFLMGTLNTGPLKDDYALATGAGIGYVSKPLRGFGFGLNGFFIFDVSSSALDEPDPATRQMNRYEIGLYDVTDPHNRKDLDRLEEAYLYFKQHGISIGLGRMAIQTPFINGQDGRMRPSLVEGVYAHFEPHEGLSLAGGWLWAMSPRSTVKWYRVEQSIGLYPVGVNREGKPSAYAGQLQSAGVALAGATYRWNKQSIDLWSTAIENVSHTAMLQYEQRLLNGFKVGFQYIRQDRIGNGGSDDPERRYVTSANSQIAAIRLEKTFRIHRWQINAMTMGRDGQFIFPREWGREPFYTFIPRERTEGVAGSRAITVQWQIKNPKQTPFTFELLGGWVNNPMPTEFAKNKYGLGSYFQWNGLVKYQGRGKWSGVQITALTMAKLNRSGSLAAKHIFNRMNLLHGELIVDYFFGPKPKH